LAAIQRATFIVVRQRTKSRFPRNFFPTEID